MGDFYWKRAVASQKETQVSFVENRFAKPSFCHSIRTDPFSKPNLCRHTASAMANGFTTAFATPLPSL